MPDRSLPFAACPSLLFRLIFLLVVFVLSDARAQDAVMDLRVDASDVLSRQQHVHLTMSAHPGPLTLAYPRWVPGEHRPNGPITQLVDLHIRADGRDLAWMRDPLDAFAFHVDVPSGASALEADFDYVSPLASFGTGFGKSPNVTPHLLELLFGQLVLYPADARADTFPVQASFRLPAGWTYDGAIHGTTRADGTVVLPVMPLSRLVDSPILAGEHTRAFALPSSSMRGRLWIAADDESALTMDGDQVDALGRLMDETTAVLGPPARSDYVWLVALSHALTHDGTEHLESADVREPPDFFRDASRAYRWTVLPHELFHAWNGKFRRPSGMLTRNFQQPVDDSLLWIYEGLTRYYGDVLLPTRSGLASREQTLDYLAYVAAQAEDGRPGRRWRSVADTAVAIPAYGDAPFEGTADRRGADYYNEGMLVWLEADVRIRQATHGARSLDDACRRFFSHTSTSGEVAPYDLDDVVEALHETADLDWSAFFASRIRRVGAPAPLEGLREAGWEVTHDDVANPFADRVQEEAGVFNFSASLGVWVDRDGTIQDVEEGSVAARQRLASGWRIVTAGDRAWSIEALRDSIRQAESSKTPIRLTLAYMDVTRTVDLDWHRGLRIPHLRRIPSATDVLARLFAPHRVPSYAPTAHSQETVP